MAISDVLFEAIEDINGYLYPKVESRFETQRAASSMYQGELRAEIEALLLDMRRLQAKLDNPQPPGTSEHN